jgi:cytochrome b6-f complex iron-sulfur subunit
MQRRRLLKWAGWIALGNLLSGITGFLTGCRKSSDADAEGYARFVDVAVLDEAGFILQDYFAKDPIIVVRDPKDKSQIHAVNINCTHQKCLVNWNRDQSVFVCPCHGSTFAPDGRYLQGPAKDPLPTFPVKIRDKEVWVKAD